MSTEAFTTFGSQRRFPFDQPLFSWRFELSHFVANIDGKLTDVRFDVYRSDNDLSFKPECDGLPEFDISYGSAEFLSIRETKGASN